MPGSASNSLISCGFDSGDRMSDETRRYVTGSHFKAPPALPTDTVKRARADHRLFRGLTR
jgi:hypothetical protein